VATVVAVGVSETGEHRVLGCETGPSEDHAFWLSFLRSLVKRGLGGVRLVISDAHEGLRRAVGKVFSSAAWQRCRVHFMRNLLSVVPKAAQETVAAIVRTIFLQADHLTAMTQLRDVEMLRPKFPEAAELPGGGDRGPPGTPALSSGTSPAPALHQPAGAAPQGDQAADQRRGDLPQPRLAPADGGDPPPGAGRGVAGRRTSLLQLGSMSRIDDELQGGETPKELLAAIA
jgi:hypothetical protein